MKKILGILLGFLLFVGGPAIADNQVILMGLGGPDWSNVAITGGNVGADTYGDDASLTNAELKTLDDCETTELFVGGGAGSAPVCTTATGSDAPARATSPTFVTPVLGDASATSLSTTPTSAPSVSFTDSDQTDPDVSTRIYANSSATGTGAEIADLYFQAMGAQGTAGTLQTAFWWDGSAESLILPLSNNPVTPTLAIGSVGTGIYASAVGDMDFAIDGIRRILLNEFAIQNPSSGYFFIRHNSAGSITNPLYSFYEDNDSGFSRAATDAPTVIAGKVEAQRWTEASRTIETNASVCQDNSGVELKTVAAHGLAIDDVVQVAAGTGALCGGLSASTNYYVLAVGSTTTATLSASRGGSIVAYSTTGSAFTSYNLEITASIYGSLGIGTPTPNAPLEVKGAYPGTVGGFGSGQLHVTTSATAEFSNSIITGHSSYNTNTQLWYLGSLAAANDDIGFNNRLNGSMHFHTNNTLRMDIGANGDVTIGSSIDEVTPTFSIVGDADSDAADVSETLSLTLIPNATPTSAVWQFNNTQALGYKFANGSVEISGGNIRNVTTVNAASYDLLITDYILNVTYTDTGTVAIDLKTAQAVEGRIIHIKDSDFNAGTNNITITTEGAETIDEAATYVITANGNAVSLYSDGSHWFIY